MPVWRRIEGSSWQETLKNEENAVEILDKVKETRKIVGVIENGTNCRKRKWICHCMRSGCLLIDAIKRTIKGKRGMDRKRFKMIDGIK